MRAVVTVIGKDMVGILAKVSTACASCNANVIEVTQSVMQDMFAMIMMVDISSLNVDFDSFVSTVENIGTEMALSTHVMHEDIFNSMHRI
ncbi:MAG: ACT domain-containing protein [Angelakisella sp.]